jgi:hypothetical protein
VVECLPSKAMSSNPITTKNKSKKTQNNNQKKKKNQRDKLENEVSFK